ncbi:hypothetical protein MKZ38_006907 [Zalerion maritima]|uniref:Uncharacterized protein n=1 Tax=Zalerion maritima TaxID=339359 RepID=A0AAD5RJJ5_9PEZI|nr:hypothetical protein MKZ38_006907 [Zalerion maritima]
MSEFLGSTISLISKSDIRYVGVLHEINSEESTVSLENVKSWGTEGRKGNPDEEILSSAQVYEYIVFRGSDVKDLRIEDGPGAREEKPAAVPDDPAIVGARARPVNGPGPGPGPGPGGQQGPPGPPGPGGPGGLGGFGQNPWGGNQFYGQQMGGWGRGGIGPGPGPGGFYPPPPGWMPPGHFTPGPGGPGGPPGPGPWNNFGAFPPGPPGPPGAPGGPGAPGAPGQMNRPGSGAPGPSELGGKPAPAPIGAAIADKKPTTGSQNDIPSEPKSLGQGPTQQAMPTPPILPTDTKPSIEEVKTTAASLPASQPTAVPTIPTGPSTASAPTGPKAARSIVPAIPAVPKFTPPVSSAASKATDKATPVNTAAAIRDATQAARAAVAVAMSKMEHANAPAPQNGAGSAMDNLTKKVNEMRVNAAATRGGPPTRGRARGGRHPGAKVEVPAADFDFASSNAKFNKDEIVKEAGVTPGSEGAIIVEPLTTKENEGPPAYNKKTSFFDNISSEARDRAENGGQKPGGREWRGEEQRRNIETFGSPSVDNGYRSNFRRGGGRGRVGMRGRGYRGRGRGGYAPHDAQAS